MSSSEIAIRVSNLSKCYQIYDAPHDRLKQFIIPKIQKLFRRQPKQYFKEFWALKDVSFEIKKGETIGIIGRNGSGKSTLLQLICGTLSPSSGTIEVNGRVAALLELGSGFNPEFTGRENIFMNAAILGLCEDEINNRFDDIVEFSGVAEFIEQPIKTYSSGMIVRLAFAVQSQVNPDILIIDEALSVGDAKFQAKCFERLRQLKENGTSILLVTHSSEQIVSHCTKAILLNNGQQLKVDEPRYIVNYYLDLLFGKKRNMVKNVSPFMSTKKAQHLLSNTKELFSTRSGYNHHEYRWGDGAASILDYYLESNGEFYPPSFVSGQKVSLGFSISFHNDLFRPILGVIIKTKEGVTVYGVNTEMLNSDALKVTPVTIGSKETTVQAIAYFDCILSPGDYFISIGVATRHGETDIPHDRRYDAIHFVVAPHEDFIGLSDLKLNMLVDEM